jgi:cobalt-precorrin 5A hydrolase/precorrin-3B C17-methyltransferase
MKSSSQFHSLAVIATTPQAAKILQPLCQNADVTLWLPESLKGIEEAQYYSGSLKEHLGSIWNKYRSFAFCLASGAVVRLISPLLQNKATDPAVVVIDAQGNFVSSLCGGHQGGADILAQLLAQQLGATPVLTGASSSLELPGIDVLGIPYGWHKGEGNWTEVMAAIAEGRKKIKVIQEAGSTLWQENLPDGHPFLFDIPEDNINKQEKNIAPSAYICIGYTQTGFISKFNLSKVQWHPRVLWVGIGCERGTSYQLIEKAVRETCERYNLATNAIASIATIDLKADEVGILELCRRWNLPLQTFPAEALKQVEVPNPSNIVNQEVDTPSVAEAAAILGSQKLKVKSATRPERSEGSKSEVRTMTNDNLKSKISNLKSLIVPKQIFKQEGETGAVTIAIALSELEYTGRTGKLYLVGIGPGSLEQITPGAKTAIVEADAVIGYSLYTDLIRSLFRPGQIIESLPITQERQRAERAIELAQWGLTVAVVSSGDCGIYGMAGLVLEELQQKGWDGKTPQVEVFPGISALQAAAARVGAPIMHDFCAISLSNLLTPWELIKKRLEAAAIGDFVTAIYNPRSQQRTEQIMTAQEIFLQYCHPDTPVAIVRAAYRQDEEVTITSLKKMLDFPIDMLTIILIGNSNTSEYNNWLITPRGYFKN